MAYFIIAGILGLGFIAYRKRKSLIYNALKVYTDISDTLENQTELTENFKVKHFTLDNNSLYQFETLEEIKDNNYKYIITKIRYNNKHYHVLEDKNEIEDLNILSQKYKDKARLLDGAPYLLAITFNLKYEDELLFKEKDVSSLINSFVVDNSVLDLNKETNKLMLNYIKNYYNLKIDMIENQDFFENYKIEWIILDNNVEIQQSSEFTIKIVDDKVTIIIN